MDLSIIIVTYKAKAKLRVALNALFASHTSYSYEVIVVDNDSRDGTLEMLEREFMARPEEQSDPRPGARLAERAEIKPPLSIIPNTNEGFSKGNNRGIRQKQGDYVLILNPDTKVAPDTLQVMMDFMQARPDVGIATCKLVKGDGTLDRAVRRSFPTTLSAVYRFMGLSLLFPKSKQLAKYNLTYTSEDEEREIETCNGAFMLISPACLQAIKSFDEAFFMYDEDIDLCLRAHQAGFKVWYYPKTVTIHYKGQPYKASPRSLYIFHQSKWIYNKKHLNPQRNFFINFLIYLGIWAHFAFKLVINPLRRLLF